MQWLRSDPPNGPVHAVAFLGDGDLVAGGAFSQAAGAPASRVARWNGRTWLPMGTGLRSSGIATSSVAALVERPDGSVVAGGSFTLAGDVVVNRIAAWDGYAWRPFGSGANNMVRALVTMPDGSLVAAGSFTSIDGVAASRIARWDGVSWSPLGTGLGGTAHALALMPNGDLLVGGAFATAGGQAARSVARWDGTVWSPMSFGGTRFPVVQALSVLPNGNPVAGVDAVDSGVLGRVFEWTGAGWSTLDSQQSGLSGVCMALRVDASGQLLAGGDLALAGVDQGLVQWDGSVWSAAGGGVDGPVRALLPAPVGPALVRSTVVAGDFSTTGGVPTERIASWNGVSLARPGGGLNATVADVVSLPDGRVFARMHTSVMSLRGLVWERCADAWDVCALSDALFAFTGHSLRIWSGQAWSSGTTPNTWPGLVSGIEADSHQGTIDLVTTTVGLSTYTVERWYRSQNGLWSRAEVLSTGTNLIPVTLLEQGVLVTRQSSGGSLVYRMRDLSLPTTWFPDDEVHAAIDWNGNKVVAGAFTDLGVPMNRIGMFDRASASWQGFAGGLSGTVRALAVLHDGSLVAGGDFTSAGGVAVDRLARWTGSAWAPMPGGGTNGPVHSLDVLADGTLVVGGLFTQAGGLPAQNVAFFGNVCPASVQPQGPGCDGSVGPLALSVLSQPWLGTDFLSLGTGFAPTAIGFSLIGLHSPALPLNLVHPAAGPNCVQLASTTSTQLLLPTNGQSLREKAPGGC